MQKCFIQRFIRNFQKGFQIHAKNVYKYNIYKIKKKKKATKKHFVYRSSGKNKHPSPKNEIRFTHMIKARQ